MSKSLDLALSQLTGIGDSVLERDLRALAVKKQKKASPDIETPEPQESEELAALLEQYGQG